ncbi:MAG TPA: DUF1549 domain-containing protein [Polyangiaceae bacterium]|nr:DUF1549 domain-containing protein [Polyangiaceae bacterium]
MKGVDLTGLSPAPQDVQAFSEDPSDAAYLTCVERLLDEPAFGEQRARYWLELTGTGPAATPVADLIG